MLKLDEISNLVKFDKEAHSYHVNGKKLISVTSLLGNYKEEFDPSGIIARSCAKRDGVSVEEIKSKWDKKKNDAANRGTKFHSCVENYIKTGKIDDNEYSDIINEFSLIDFKGKLNAEVKLFNIEYGVAGTSDIIELYPDNSFICYDAKTNEKFSTKPKYGGKMLYPVNHLGDSHLEVYSLQLWCYSIMLEKFGYSIRETPKILWVNHNSRKIETIECLNIKEDAFKFLEHYKSVNLF